MHNFMTNKFENLLKGTEEKNPNSPLVIKSIKSIV